MTSVLSEETAQLEFEVPKQLDSTENVATEKPLSEREFKLQMAKAYKERNEKIKQNKAMLEELNLEVAYWKTQSDLLKYRYEKMDYYLKNLELEPVYVKAMAEQRIKEQAAIEASNQEKTTI
jgi:hypothetical protein